MIRVRPLGLVLAILFMVLGPQSWFLARNRAAHTQAQPVLISPILPDAAAVSDQPTRGAADMVQTKQGWKVRIGSTGRDLEYLLVGAAVFAFYWPLRQKALARKREDADPAGEGSNEDD